MNGVGTAGRPHINLGKLREFLLQGNFKVQHMAVDAVDMLTLSYGTCSLPIWNELLESALDSEWVTVKAKSGPLVHRYMQDCVGIGEIVEKLRSEAGVDRGSNTDRFLLDAAMIAIRNGYLEEAIEVLSSVIQRDRKAPQMEELASLKLMREFGGEEWFGQVEEGLSAAIAEKKISGPVSRDATGLQEPPRKFRGKAPGKPAVQPGKTKRAVRS